MRSEQLRQVVVIALLAASNLGVSSATVDQVLSADMRGSLDMAYPGWRVAGLNDEVRGVVSDRLGPTPNIVTGDFDGNGSSDTAVLIEYPRTDQPGKTFSHYSVLVAFLREPGGVRAFAVRDRQPGPNPELYLTLRKKGASGFDLEAQKGFVFENDSVGEWHFGKAGGSYLYENGRFRHVLESD